MSRNRLYGGIANWVATPPAPERTARTSATDKSSTAYAFNIRTPSQSDTVTAGENWGDRDAAWPALAEQLRHAVTAADRATVLGTAALALTQVDLVVRAMRADPADAESATAPMTLDTTVEFDVGTGSVVTRRWSRHPACAC